jgi:uncharacterized protein YkwD
MWHKRFVPCRSLPLAQIVGGGLLFCALAACRPAADPLQATGPASVGEAAQFVLALVNRDRDEAGLPPVEWDEAAARAAQVHADDMARNGFTGHWGSDGSVPEQRYSRAGGVHFAQENAACFFDAVARELDPNPVFERAELEKIESAFINEVPPNDGHRQNILTARHTHLGVGLSKPTGIAQACMAQEFTDQCGDYAPLPATAKVGDRIRVEGEVHEPVEFGGVGLSRIALQQPLPVASLSERGTYQVPAPYALYFPKGYQTPKPVDVDGNRFGIDLELDDEGRPGRYGVSVWGKHPGNDALVMISLRMIDVK